MYICICVHMYTQWSLANNCQCTGTITHTLSAHTYTDTDEPIDITAFHNHILYIHTYISMYLFDWREFLLALHGQRAQIRLHVLHEFLHRFRAAGRHLHTHSTPIQL